MQENGSLIELMVFTVPTGYSQSLRSNYTHIPVQKQQPTTKVDYYKTVN